MDAGQAIDTGVNVSTETAVNEAGNEVVLTSPDNYFIVRCDRSGVFAGTIIKREDRYVRLANARRLWFWSGAASLSQLSVEGVKNPSRCKFPCEVPSVELLDVIEILPCSEAARKSIAGVHVWQM